MALIKFIKHSLSNMRTCHKVLCLIDLLIMVTELVIIFMLVDLCGSTDISD